MTERTHDAVWPLSGPPPTEAHCQPSGETERVALISGLKAQIRNGVYQPDIRDLARSLASMLVRDL